MGYTDKQIAAAQKRIGDAVSGKNLRSAIRKLQERSQVRETLEEARARGTIVAKRKLAKRAGSDNSIIASPFTETLDGEATTRTYYETVQELVSTDGLFTIQFFNVKDINFLDANRRDVKFIYQDIPPAGA